VTPRGALGGSNVTLNRQPVTGMSEVATSTPGSQRCPCGSYSCPVLERHRHRVRDEITAAYTHYRAPLLAFTRSRMRSPGVSEAQAGAEDMV
jgi:hypothetical protein